MDQNLPKLIKIGNWIATLLLGNTRELIARIDERTIHIEKGLENLRGDFKVMNLRMDDMSVKVSDMFPKVDILWKAQLGSAHSRRELNAYGKKVLQGSGIKEIINEKKDELFNLVRAKGAKNIYDAERDILSVVKQLPERYPEVIDELKTGAFNTGADLDAVLFVGGMYLRDLILPDLGFPG